MPDYRLVATDIDGTLIRTDGTLSARTSAVLAALPVPVVLVTGRPLRWLAQLYDQLAEPLPTVCANGAVVYDPATDTVLRRDPLDVDLLAEVAGRLRAAVPDITLATEIQDGNAFRYEHGWPLRHAASHPAVRLLATPAEIASVPAVKLLARSATAPADEFYELVSRTLGSVAETTHSSSQALVEISAGGVTKAAGLAWVCERDGITAAQVLAFGDMPNDLPMLSWAGRAVAMSNAHPAVREVADEVTLSNDEDGVAAYLSACFDLGL